MKKKTFVYILLAATMLLAAGCGGTPDTGGGEEMTDLMFDDVWGIYNYCPTIMQVDDETRYVWYASNQIPTNITDYVGFRIGKKQPDGRWVYSEKQLVVEHSPLTNEAGERNWDNRHICDPSVIRGEFRDGDAVYTYAMAYTGCFRDNNEDNEVGLIFSNSPEGPWVRVYDKPFRPWTRDMSDVAKDSFQWGNGQPTLVSVDKKGKVMLSYTIGRYNSSSTTVERWDISDIRNPVMEYSTTMTTRGLYNLTGGKEDTITNNVMAYDPATKRYWLLCDTHPWEQDLFPTGVPVSTQISYMESKDGEIGDTFRTGGTTWNMFECIDEAKTGYRRNHNCGFVTDPYGHLLDSKKIEVAYTVAELSPSFTEALWTFRIHCMPFEIKE